MGQRFKQLNLLKQGREDLTYYDRLSRLFEKVAWITTGWAFILNFISPTSVYIKNFTFLLLFATALFILFYFRYLYWKIRRYDYRFYAIDVIFPFLVWFFVHLQPNFHESLLPYYIIILVSSLNLHRFDTILTFAVSSVLIFIQELVLTPINLGQIELGLTQIISLAVFTTIALWLANASKQKDEEALEILEVVSKENEKAEILKRYAHSLALDKERSQVFFSELSKPVLVITPNKKIEEYNNAFGDLSDFKNNGLVGKDLDYILKFDATLDLNNHPEIPENVKGVLTTRRNKTKAVNAKFHLLYGQEGKVRQVVIIMTPRS